jgi:hypothetical protein
VAPNTQTAVPPLFVVLPFPRINPHPRLELFPNQLAFKHLSRNFPVFYENWLSGKDRHEALHDAQREMRDRMKARWEGEDQPFYWGASVLVGR